MGRMQDKVVLLTGADGGICHAAAKLFVQEGAKVMLVEKCPEVMDKAAELVANGGEALGMVCDVSIEENWTKMLDACIERFGTVDCCVNGAAEFSYTGDYCSPTFSMEEWDRVMNTNLKSMLWSYKTVLKYMIDHEIKGNFINFSSATALSFMGPGCQAYPMSKSAITICTNNMAASNAKYGIRFNMLAPNAVYVPKQDMVYKTYGEALKKSLPIGFYGEPNDAAYAMLYLASDEARFITGVNIPIDGGWYTCH